MGRNAWGGASIALSFVGVLLLGFDPAVFAQPLGSLLVIGGAFSMSFAMLMMRRVVACFCCFRLSSWIPMLPMNRSFPCRALKEGERLMLRRSFWKK